MQNSRRNRLSARRPSPAEEASVCLSPAGGPQARGRQRGCLSLSGPFAWLCRELRRLPHRVAPRRARGAATAAPTPAPTCGPSPGHGGAALPLRVPLPVWGALPERGASASCSPGGRVTHFPRGALPRSAGGRAGSRRVHRKLAPGWPAAPRRRGGRGRRPGLAWALSAGNGLENAFRRLIPPSPRACI